MFGLLSMEDSELTSSEIVDPDSSFSQMRDSLSRFSYLQSPARRDFPSEKMTSCLALSCPGFSNLLKVNDVSEASLDEMRSLSLKSRFLRAFAFL